MVQALHPNTPAAPNASSKASSFLHGSFFSRGWGGQTGGRPLSSSHIPPHQDSSKICCMSWYWYHERHSTSSWEFPALIKPRVTNMACAALVSVVWFEQSLDQMASRDPFQFKLLCDHKKAGVRKLLRKENGKNLSSPHTIQQHTNLLFQQWRQYPPS